MNNKKFYLTNVVLYDGIDAYVCKFILRGENFEISENSKQLVNNYLQGNGELLKFDTLYEVNFDNIKAMENSEDAEIACAVDRWKKLYF